MATFIYFIVCLYLYILCVISVILVPALSLSEDVRLTAPAYRIGSSLVVIKVIRSKLLSRLKYETHHHNYTLMNSMDVWKILGRLRLYANEKNVAGNYT